MSSERKFLVDAEAARAGAQALRSRVAGLRAPSRSVHLHNDETEAAKIERLADALTQQPEGDAVEVRNLAGSPCAERDAAVAIAEVARLRDLYIHLGHERDAAIAEVANLKAGGDMFAEQVIHTAKAAIAERDRLAARLADVEQCGREYAASTDKQLQDFMVEVERLRRVLRGEDEAANKAVIRKMNRVSASLPWSAADKLADAQGVLRAAGQAAGVVEDPSDELHRAVVGWLEALPYRDPKTTG